MTIAYHWLTPPAPAAIAVLRLEADPGCFDRPPPATGGVGLRLLLGADGHAVDEVVLWNRDGALLCCCHGGPGVRAAVEAALQARACGRDDGAGIPDDWSALAGAAHMAVVERLLQGGALPAAWQAVAQRPISVLLTGPSNAGKSTLLNAWCGRQRALVSAAPGTTRDLVSGRTRHRGWRLQLVDSAGMREVDDPLERAGQELVAKVRATVDVVMHCSPCDASSVIAEEGDLCCRSKADLVSSPPAELWWSDRLAHGRSPATGLAVLGDAVLQRMGLLT